MARFHAPDQSAAHPHNSRLIGVLSELACARTLDDMLRVLTTGARELTGADGVSVIMRDGDQCFYVDEDAIGPLWKGQRFPLETCISGWAILHRQPTMIEDIYQDSRIPHDAYRPTFVKSLIMVPVCREDPVAAIGAYWSETRRPAPEEVEMLTAIANGAAVALTNVALRCSLSAIEKASAAKSQFLAGASHDLRQPFQAMRLFLDVLDMKIEEPGQRRALGSLGASIRTAEGLLTELLDVTRIESGATLTLQNVSPAAVIGQIVEEMRPIAAVKELRIRSVGRSDVEIFSDEAMLKRILCNLIGNAIRYTEHGGVLVGVRRRHDHATIEVWDTGIGIQHEAQELIFTDFYRVQSAARDRTDGVGLGLAIVARLCDLLGYGVRLSSRPGRGSVFRIDIPFAHAA